MGKVIRTEFVDRGETSDKEKYSKKEWDVAYPGDRGKFDQCSVPCGRSSCGRTLRIPTVRR